MTDNIIDLYKGIELANRKRINLLMEDWRNEVAPNKIKFKDGQTKSGKKCFAADGFYPGYYRQKNKLVFIAREMRYFGGDNIETGIDWYNNNEDHNQRPFIRHILNIVQGVKNDGKLKFKDLESANDYIKKMNNTNNYGFATLNISKYANISKTSRTADYKLMNQFLSQSNLDKRNYFTEELTILQPNIIVTGNLLEWKIDKSHINQCFGTLIEIKRFKKTKTVLYDMELNGEKIKLIDMPHFSDCHYTDKDLYNSIMKLLFG